MRFDLLNPTPTPPPPPHPPSPCTLACYPLPIPVGGEAVVTNDQCIKARRLAQDPNGSILLSETEKVRKC